MTDTSKRPDQLDEINAFRAGWRHGRDIGECSAKEAEIALRALPTTIPITSGILESFCQGTVDGAKDDKFRYILSYLEV